MATSRVPDVLDALVASFRLSLPGVQVTDGHPAGTVQLDDDMVAVGAGGVEMPSVEVEQSYDDSLCAPEESGTVYCVASAIRGDTDIRTVRVAAYRLLAGVESAVRADPTLGGVSSWAEVQPGPFVQGISPDGAVGEVAFRVAYRAYL